MKAIELGDDVRQVLVLGAHCDDVEIGCGGVLTAIARHRPDIAITIAVFSGEERRAQETRAALTRLLGSASRFQLHAHPMRDGFFPADWAEIKQRFEQLKGVCSPDVVFTHHERDRHQDHRAISELTWNTFRNHLILEYEIPKYDGDLGNPSFFVPLPEEIVRHKIATLLECFESQSSKAWFSADLFSGLMRIRGMECNSESGFAEAFYCRKLVARW